MTNQEALKGYDEAFDVWTLWSLLREYGDKFRDETKRLLAEDLGVTEGDWLARVGSLDDYPREPSAPETVYLVATENGDDMCGGFNIAYASLDEREAREARSEYDDEESYYGVYAIPLGVAGWLGYGGARFAPDDDTTEIDNYPKGEADG